MKVLRFATCCLIVAFIAFPSWQGVQAAATLGISPTSGPPTTQIAVNGGSFGISEKVHIYFDGEQLVSAMTDLSGNFSSILQVPMEALPSLHWVRAKGVSSGATAQKSFTVRVDWPQFHYDRKHQGYNPYENVLSPFNVSGLKEAWRFTTEGPIGTSPIVAKGICYVGSWDKKLYALDAVTGILRWSYTTGNWISSSPAVANGVVYVGSNDYKIHALNATTGALKWSYSTGSYVTTSPAVAYGIVYVGSYDDKIYALDATTGALKWTYKTGNDIKGGPAVANGIVYVGSVDHKIYALNAITGALKWSYTTGNDIDASPAVVNGIVYVGSFDKKLYALDAMTGGFKWSHTTGGGIGSTPAVANGVVYVGSNDCKLYALDAMTGKPKWTRPTGGAVLSSPAVANEVVYVGSQDGKLYAFDARTGDWLWSATTGNIIGLSSPAVADGMVYLGSNDKSTYAYSLPGLPNPHWAQLADMNYRRSGCSLTLLKDGKVLIAGGQTDWYMYDARYTVAKAELFDPGAKSFILTGSLVQKRMSHGAVLLKDGRVLIAGGSGGSIFPEYKSVELYDPATGHFSFAGNMSTKRIYWPTCTRLPSGKVLIAGGAYEGWYATATDSIDAYDPVSGTIEWNVGRMLVGRAYYHSAAVIGDDKMLIIGGKSRWDTRSSPAAELYDFVSNQSGLPSEQPASGTGTYKLIPLPNGKVLVKKYVIGYPEFFDPLTRAFETITSCGTFDGEPLLLKNGRVLFCSDPLRIFNPNTKQIEEFVKWPEGFTGRGIVLADGSVLFINETTAKAYLFWP